MFTLGHLDVFELLESFGRGYIGVVDLWPVITSFRNEEEHHDQLCDQKWLGDMKKVFPTEIVEDHPSDDGRQYAESVGHQLENRDSAASLMHKIHVSHQCHDEGLVGRNGKALEKTSGKECLV